MFGTNDSITREQLAAILYRYASYKQYDTSSSQELAAFTDAGSIASYAFFGMKRANAEGLVTGRATTILAPAGAATRAGVATNLMRFDENIAK